MRTMFKCVAAGIMFLAFCVNDAIMAQDQALPKQENQIQQKAAPTIKPLKWTVRRKGRPGETLFSSVVGKGLIVVSGKDGLILTSPDGIEWTKRNFGPQGENIQMEFAGDHFIASGHKGTIITSADGVKWTIRSSGINTFMMKMTYENGIYFGYAPYGGRKVLTSRDLIKWSSLDLPQKHIPAVTPVYGNGQFVIAGHLYEKRKLGKEIVSTPIKSTIYSSKDGKNWVPRAATAAPITQILYTNGRFIAATWSWAYPNPDGWADQILISDDGITWNISSGTINSKLLYGNGQYVTSKGSSNDGHSIVSSSDGLNWEVRQRFPPSVPVFPEEYSDNHFIAYGAKFDEKSSVSRFRSGHIWISKNGIDWTGQSFELPDWAGQIFYGNGKFIAIGQGTIMTADLEME